ncbi:unnamed protein product [Cyprideis torosa]|uniref:GPR158/179 extracellular domain-containing protein n=1 Tax=Cyprideis torosa TaxID=163714 RepID=A0A7R8W2E5_9CRUS|nr:unnamed protein product [Cyprideis torosa]CAG0879672.1 unnamed protein product [Cyprideis torosa]
MAESDQKGEQLLAEARKKINSPKGLLGSLFGSSGKAEEAVELFERAANSFKMAKQWNKAGKAFCEAAQLENRNGSRHNEATKYVDAANCFRKTDPGEAVKCLMKAVEVYTDMGRFTMAAKHHQTIAEICETELVDLEKALQHYERAADYFKGEESKSQAAKCMLKVASFAAHLENYKRAIDIYESVATQNLENSLLKYSAKEYFFRAGICHLCIDPVNAQLAVTKYEEMFPAFQDSREAKLLKILIQHVEDNNEDEFSEAVKEYDSVSRLDNWYTTLLLRVKKNISDEGDLKSHRSPFTSDVLDDLVNVLLDGTVFEIVQSLSEIQAETEKLLFRERLELQNTLREEATSGLVTDRREMEIRHRDELRRFDMKAVTQLDQLVMDQQVMLQRSGLPLFHVTTKAEDLKVLMNALAKGFFFSFILQKAFDNDEPGLMYHYLSVVADVSHSPKVNASGLYFSVNSSYTPSYKGFFNKTLPLFAPRAFRADDYNDPIRIERISTLNTIEADDLGAIPQGHQSMNYTSDHYRINEWYRKWLPDIVKRQDTKTTYHVKIRYANNTNETFTWHGPPGADEVPGPVQWSRPYFDCGRSNKWIFGASVPVVDIIPRHTQFRHIEFPTYVAVSVLEMDYERIDINQCPLGEGNQGPNFVAGTAKCEETTTECEPIHGYGFRRGGYQCRCKPGFRLPNVVHRPFLGDIVERATEQEFRDQFKCLPIGFKAQVPTDWTYMEPWLRLKYMSQHEVDPRHYPISNSTENISPYAKDVEAQERSFRPPHALRNESLSTFDYVARLIEFYAKVNPENCKSSLFREEDLIMRGDARFGAEEQFENEAKQALRLAHFLSSFLQIVDSQERFAELRLADKPLTVDQIMGEALSIVLGNTRVRGAGVFWDLNAFPNHTLFAPYAYSKEAFGRKFNIDDLARINDTDKVYLNKPFFRELKSRWATNLEELEKFYVKIKIRSNSTGTYKRRYERYPVWFRAPNISHGWWSAPYFDCDGFHNAWVLTYAAPFFGLDSIREAIVFKGVVSVTMELKDLDVNQCSDNFYVENAFKNSHKCDRNSYCVPILGRGFDVGGYQCSCMQGYEYPYDNGITFFDGQLVEAEFMNLVLDKKTRYDLLKCRLASGCVLYPSLLLISCLVCLARFLALRW